LHTVGLPMLHFHFSIHDSGTGSEKLGSDTFDSDAEATAFGKRVIKDLLHEEPARYANWTMKISEGARIISSISFNACAD
jgi:hypothetical protein